MEKFNFNDIKVGDTVIIKGSNISPTVATVSKVNKVTFVAANITFRKAGGFEYGGNTWYHKWAETATEEKIAEIRLATMRRNALSFIMNYNFSLLPDDELFKLYAQLKNHSKNEE